MLHRGPFTSNRLSHVQPRPKALGALREQRLAAKQELKAVRNILEHANFDLDSIFPETPLRPTAHADEIRCEHRVGSEVLAFHVSTTTGESLHAHKSMVIEVTCVDA